MNIVTTPATDEWKPEIVGKLDASSGLLASAVFDAAARAAHGATNADLRNHLLERAAGGHLHVRHHGDDDPFGKRIDAMLDAGVDAIRTGHVFDLGRVPELGSLRDRQPDEAVLPLLFVPYEATVISVTFAGEPWIFILRADEHGQLAEVLGAALSEEQRHWNISVVALVSVHRTADGEPAPVIHVDADQPEMRLIHHYLWVTWTLLALINDDRVPARREVAPAKLNAARLRRGKPALPDMWRLDLNALDYVTTIDPARRKPGSGRGGHHASPIPHDRRGHRRRLPSGRIVWVRPCRIGEMVKHLTRQRAFYEIDFQTNPGRMK